jgi:hypothetical protein
VIQNEAEKSFHVDDWVRVALLFPCNVDSDGADVFLKTLGIVSGKESEEITLDKVELKRQHRSSLNVQRQELRSGFAATGAHCKGMVERRMVREDVAVHLVSKLCKALASGCQPSLRCAYRQGDRLSLCSD